MYLFSSISDPFPFGLIPISGSNEQVFKGFQFFNNSNNNQIMFWV